MSPSRVNYYCTAVPRTSILSPVDHHWRQKNTGLKSVNVTECSLKTTEGLEGLTGLTALNLSSNHLQSLEGVRGMTSLRKLWANDNRITAVRWRRITSPGGKFLQRAVPGLKRTTETVFTVVFFFVLFSVVRYWHNRKYTYCSTTVDPAPRPLTTDDKQHRRTEL